jgi:hypothetical protein
MQTTFGVMKTRFLSLLLLLVICKVNSVQAQWQVIYPPLPDSLNFIGWGISVVDENIVWGSPKINIQNTVYPPTYLTNKYYYKTLDGGNTWSWGEIDGVTVENDAGEYWFNAHLCGVDSNSAWVVRFEGYSRLSSRGFQNHRRRRYLGSDRPAHSNFFRPGCLVFIFLTKTKAWFGEKSASVLRAFIRTAGELFAS